MENKIILQASQISIGYSHKKKQTIVASDISISLKKGKLIALIGANGIGKHFKNNNRNTETASWCCFFEMKITSMNLWL
jgi:ABC-type microcin C transport system duplicated ATPase subunit YejF